MNTVFALTLFSGEMQARGWFPRVPAVLLGLAAVVAVGVLYAREVGRLGAGRRLVLAAVRMATVLVVAFLLLRPVWVTESAGDKRRPVAVLIDASESMNSKDPRPAPEDQWRAALAYGLIDADRPFPTDPAALTSLREKLPDKPRRIEVAREALSNPKLDLFNRLRVVGPLEIATFGAARSGRETLSTEWVKTLAADQPRTALVNAAFELLNRDENEQPAALVLVTDGRDNASDKSFAELAAKYRERNIPIFVYGVGSSSFGQLRLRDAGVPESVFLDDIVVIPVRYSVKGIAEGRVSIVAKFGDPKGARDTDYVVVAEKTNIPVREGDDLREVLTFVPTKRLAELKKQEITVEVTVTTAGADGVTVETLTDGVTKPTQVVSKKLKVLVVDGLPRVDFKFLQRALLRDRRVDPRFFLTEGDREAMKSGYPWLVEFTRQLNGTLAMEREEFRRLVNDFDLLILGDVPPRFFSGEQQQVIKDFVAEGGGMIHVAGKWNAPRGWVEASEPGKASIADVLPVELPAERWPIQPPQGRYYQPFVPVLAPNAVRNPLVSLEDDPLDNADVWGRLTRVNPRDPVPPPDAPRANKKQPLPPLEWYYPATRLKPGAEVFLVHPTARTPAPDDKPMPLLVGHYFGKGYVLFCAFDDTWRWRFNEGDRYFGRFWSQCVYQAGVPRMVGTKLTQISLDTIEPQQGKSGQVYARILDENFKPLATEELEATLERIDADANDTDRFATVKLRKLDGQDGEYVAPLPFNRPGRFKLSVDPKNKSPASMEYRVNLPPDHEQSPGGMADAELMRLAADSGPANKPGKFYHEEDLHRLAKDIEPQYAPFSRRDETVLWNRWALFLLIGLLSLEWFLRKFNGLS